MNSINRKFEYRFRIHNKEELEAVSKYIKNRRIGAMAYSSWVEFNNYDSFLEWTNNLKYCDFMIRVYFNIDFKRTKFHKQIKEVLPKWVCGNDNCSDENCPYYMYNDCNLGNHKIEYLWRCILADESYTYEED